MLMRYWPVETKIPFMALRYVGVGLSILMMLASAYFVMTRGLNFGVDFAGGSVIEIAETETVTVAEVRARGPDGLTVNSATDGTGERRVVVRFGELDQSLLGAEFLALPENEREETASLASNVYVVSELKRTFNLTDQDILRNDSVGPKMSDELFRESLIALGVAVVMMFLYITFRYSWAYAVGGIGALAHDAIGAVGLFAAFQIEFDLTTVAALLTIMGYSINDSVVVFDRVREIRRKYKKMSGMDVIDIANNETLSRTFLTFGTTGIAILSIAIFGGAVLQNMSIAMLWGIVLGTYSSIYVASVLVLFLGTEVGAKPTEEVPGFTG